MNLLACMQVGQTGREWGKNIVDQAIHDKNIMLRLLARGQKKTHRAKLGDRMNTVVVITE